MVRSMGDVVAIFGPTGVGKTAVAVELADLLRERGEDPLAGFSVGEFMPLAHAEIDAALAAGRRPIVLGGTGLYLRAALTELSLAPPPPPELRARIEAAIDERGPAALHADLHARSPVAAARVEPTDRTRIVRSLELLELGADPVVPGEASE